jgi:glycosyltransferase involved in cell wall biosynthesis
MSVHNGQEFLREAIDSILNQSYVEFEFLIIDDCSTDSSAEILGEYGQLDKRIAVITNSQNLGLTKSLNLGLRAARGKYIARMDADDISLPERLNKQVAYLNSQASIGLVGSWIEIFGSENRLVKYPVSNDEIKLELLTRSPFAHPSVMFRKSCVEDFDLFYDEKYVTAQDSELWGRFSRHTQMANLPEVLLNYRSNEVSISFRKSSDQKEMALKSKYAQYEYLLGRKLLDVEKDIVAHRFNVKADCDLAISFVQELYEKNEVKGFYEVRLFRGFLTRNYLTLTLNSTGYFKGLFLVVKCLFRPFFSWRSLCVKLLSVLQKNRDTGNSK